MTGLTHIAIFDNASPELQRRIAALTPKRLAAKIGPPLMRHWRDHLKSLPSNAKGWPSTGFWEEAADSVVFLPLEDGLKLSGSKQGLHQRFKGGTITAQKKEFLTVPISPVSYGHSASEFPGLFLLKTAKGAYLVQHGTSISAGGRTVKITKAGGNSKRRLKALLNFLFKLVKSVSQKANPNVIPADLMDLALKLTGEAVS